MFLTSPDQLDLAGAPFFGEEGLDLAVEAHHVTPLSVWFYETCFIPGGCHVPLPIGRIEGGSVFGQ